MMEYLKSIPDIDDLFRNKDAFDDDTELKDLSITFVPKNVYTSDTGQGAQLTNPQQGADTMNNMFNFGKLFGPIDPEMCRLAVNGIGVKTSGGYKTFNVKTNRLVNVQNFVFDMGQDMFFLIPTTKVSKGDIIIRAGKPVCVMKTDGDTITALNYETGVVETFLPERHVFLGKTFFYQKVYSPFGQAGKGFKMGGMFKMMMMSKMFGGGNTKGGDNGFFGGGNPMMAMMMMQSLGGGDGGGLFDGMLDEIGGLDLDFTGETEDEADEKAEKVG
jgi:hypothetical protein